MLIASTAGLYARIGLFFLLGQGFQPQVGYFKVAPPANPRPYKGFCRVGGSSPAWLAYFFHASRNFAEISPTRRHLNEFFGKIGAMSWEDGLRVVKVRAEAMQMASENPKTGMASIVGLDDDTLESMLKQVMEKTHGKLKVALYLYVIICGDVIGAILVPLQKKKKQEGRVEFA